MTEINRVGSLAKAFAEKGINVPTYMFKNAHTPMGAGELVRHLVITHQDNATGIFSQTFGREGVHYDRSLRKGINRMYSTITIR